MSTAEQRKEMNEKIAKIIPLACNGNKQAEAYLYDMGYVNRIIDDLYDGDVQVNRTDIEKAFFTIAVKVPTNIFFVSNFQALMAQHVVIFNSWMDSNVFEKSGDELKKFYAHVLKDYIGELIPLVAFLTGGVTNMRNISLVSRETFMKELE